MKYKYFALLSISLNVILLQSSIPSESSEIMTKKGLYLVSRQNSKSHLAGFAKRSRKASHRNEKVSQRNEVDVKVSNINMAQFMQAAIIASVLIEPAHGQGAVLGLLFRGGMPYSGMNSEQFNATYYID